MAQIFAGITAVEKGRLQYGILGKGRLHTAGIDPAPGLSLQIPISADVIRIGMGVEYSQKLPAVFLQNLTYSAPCILIVSAVNEIDTLFSCPVYADLGGTVDVIAGFAYLNQFVHERCLPVFLFL